MTAPKRINERPYNEALQERIRKAIEIVQQKQPEGQRTKPKKSSTFRRLLARLGGHRDSEGA